MIELNAMDHALAARMNAEAVSAETNRLQACSRDELQWGGWSQVVHESFVQMNRQWRAYEDVFRHKVVERIDERWFVNNWAVSLRECGCPDFETRKLPCKHIYAIALSSQIVLPLTSGEYTTATERNEELFFHPWGKASTLRSDVAIDTI